MAEVKDAAQPGSKRERLEVESEEDRQSRIGRLLATQSDKSRSSDASNGSLNGLPSIQGKRSISDMPLPPSSVLDRAKAFLPLMASSNAELLKRLPEDLDIENTEGEERVIEMDLGLGVYDVQGDIEGDVGPEIELDTSAINRQGGDDNSDLEDDESDSEAEAEDDSGSSEGEDDSSDEGDEATSQGSTIPTDPI